ncbi:MAG: hypothetical protein VKP62_14785 [Candidatus Sericytochromatia bacterium]|nr:hypothetical protein [Candidatus Sericytochromatia bacterium]
MLQGISFDGHLAEAFVGESMRPMTFEPVVVGADPARLVYAWDSEASFVGWSNQRLFHFWPTAPGRYRVMCVAATRDGREVGRRAVTIDVRPAPRPPL